MESFANKLSDFAKPSEKEMIKIRDLTVHKLYPITSALKKPNNFGGISVRLDLEDNRFLFVPDRIASKMSDEDIEQLNLNPGKVGVKYTGESDKKFFGKSVAKIEFATI